MTDKQTAACVIHHGYGAVQRLVHSAASPPTTADPCPTPTIAGLVPVTDIMTRDVICARRDLPVRELVELVIANNIGCVPIVDVCGCPIGMVTKRDLVEQLASVYEDAMLSRIVDRLPTRGDTAEDVMLPLAFTVDEHATVSRVAGLMAHEGIHHVPIVSTGGGVIGMLSALDIVSWLAKNDGYAT